MRWPNQCNCLLAIAFAFALCVVPAVGETVAQPKSVRLPPVPARMVELDRHRAAAMWNSKFCTRWTDECVSCTKYNVLSRQAQCAPVKEADATCKPSAVRCVDFDSAIAPLVCVGVGDECGGSSLAVGQHGDEFSPASNDYCFSSKRVRSPLDLRCGTPQTVRDHCTKTAHVGYRSHQECVRQGFYVWRQYRRAIERLIQDSNRLGLR